MLCRKVQCHIINTESSVRHLVQCSIDPYRVTCVTLSTVSYLSIESPVCVCVCVRACARVRVVCVCVCVCVIVINTSVITVNSNHLCVT